MREALPTSASRSSNIFFQITKKDSSKVFFWYASPNQLETGVGHNFFYSTDTKLHRTVSFFVKSQQMTGATYIFALFTAATQHRNTH